MIDAVALTTDAWTSLAEHSYITGTCHVINDDIILCSFVLETIEVKESHTSINLLEQLQTILTNWDLDNKSIVFVSDNASDISHALRDLGCYTWLGCMAHNINLIVQVGLKEECISKIIGKIKNIVKYIRQIINARNSLRAYEKSHNLPELTVVQECETRWNSCHDMIQRIIDLFGPISDTLARCDREDLMLTVPDLKLMEALVSFLNKFKSATVYLSGQLYTTSSLMKPIMEKLKKHLATNPNDHPIIKKI